MLFECAENVCTFESSGACGNLSYSTAVKDYVCKKDGDKSHKKHKENLQNNQAKHLFIDFCFKR